MDFHTMKRRALQALCKKHNIPANTTNLEMADNLASLLLKKPELGQLEKSDIKIIDKDEFKCETRRAKKVRFCLEQEQNGFVDLTKSGDGNSVGKCKPRCSNLGITENPKVGEDVAVRTTRSKRGTGAARAVSSPIERKRLKRGLTIDTDENGRLGSNVGAEVIVVLSSPENTITRSRRGKVKGGEVTKASLDDGPRVDAEVVAISSCSGEKMRTASRWERLRSGVEKPSSSSTTRVHEEVVVPTSTENKKKRGAKARAAVGLDNNTNRQQENAIECPVKTQVAKGPIKNTLKPDLIVPRRSKRKSSIMCNSIIPEGAELLLKEKVDEPKNEKQMVNEETEVAPKPVKPRRRSLRVASRVNTSEQLDWQKTASLEVERESIRAHESEQATRFSNRTVPSFSRSDIGLARTIGKKPCYQIIPNTEESLRASNSQDVVEDEQDDNCLQELQKEVSELPTVSVSCDVNLFEELIGELEELVSDSLVITTLRSSPLSEASNPFNVKNKEKVATRSNTVLVNIVAQRDEADGLQLAQADTMHDAASAPVMEDRLATPPQSKGEEDAVGQQQVQKEPLFYKLIGEFEELVSESLQIIDARTSTLSEDSGSSNIEVVTKKNADYVFENNDEVVECENDARLSEPVSELRAMEEVDIVDEFSVLQESHNGCQVVYATESKVKVDDANRDKDSSIPFTESPVFKSYSCYTSGEIKTGKQYQSKLGSDAVSETVKRRPDAFIMQRTPVRSCGQLQGHLSANGMKENTMNSKTEKSSNHKVEKSQTKRRALENLQNSLNR